MPRPDGYTIGYTNYSRPEEMNGNELQEKEIGSPAPMTPLGSDQNGTQTPNTHQPRSCPTGNQHRTEDR